MTMNLTGAAGYPALMPQEINIVDVYRDICSGLDHQVIVCLFLIVTFYTVVKVIMPLSLAGLASMAASFEGIFRPLFGWVIEVLEGLSLLSILYIIALLWMGGKLTPGFKVWAGILISFVVLAVVPNFINWFNRGRKDGFFKGFRTMGQKLREIEV